MRLSTNTLTAYAVITRISTRRWWYAKVGCLQLHRQLDNARPGCQTPELICTNSDFQAPRPKVTVSTRVYSLVNKITEGGKGGRAPRARRQGRGAWYTFLTLRRLRSILSLHISSLPQDRRATQEINS